MGEFDKTVPLRKEYPQCGSHIHIFCNLFIFCFWILFSAISHQSQNIFLSVLTLGHPSEFWKFLFSNLVFTTPEVYLKGCIHCLLVTNDTYYDNHIVWYEWAEKETKKIGSFKTRKHKLFLWSSFVFQLYTIWQKMNWSVRDFPWVHFVLSF